VSARDGFWLRRHYAWVLFAAAVVLVVGGLVVLFSGNPQWSRWIYVFRAGVWPGEEPEPPPAFTGTWRRWRLDASLVSVSSYRDGRLHGWRRLYHPNGTLAQEEMREAGERHGVYREWYAHGTPKVRGRYRSGERQGEWTWYYADGSRERVGCYDAGEREGRWLTYAEDGTLVLEREYVHGEDVTGDLSF
jgi:hypothetical protein